jgi:hypothetical protein
MYEDREKDWVEGAERDLDSAEDAGDEKRLEVLESLNDKLEEELELDRPTPSETPSQQRDEDDAPGH